MVVVAPDIRTAGIPPTAVPVAPIHTIAALGERVLLGLVAAVLAVLVPGAAAGLMDRPVGWSALFSAPD